MKKYATALLGGRIGALSAVLACCAVAQNPADDPGGWSKAKWGMTQDEIKAAFPATNFASYGINQWKFAVALGFKDNRLTGVHLKFAKALVSSDGSEVPLLKPQTPAATIDKSSSRQAKKEAAKAAADNATSAFLNGAVNQQIVTDAKESVLSGLIEKYGNPTTHSNSGGNETFEWLFPSTKITLLWFHGEYRELDALDLFYAPREKSSDL